MIGLKSGPAVVLKLFSISMMDPSIQPRVLSASYIRGDSHLFRVVYRKCRVLYVEIPQGVFEDDDNVAAPDILAILPSTIPTNINTLDIGRISLQVQMEEHEGDYCLAFASFSNTRITHHCEL